MIYIYFVCAIFMVFISAKITKDIVSPPVILSAIWGIIFFILIICTYEYNHMDIYYIIFILGNICFILGFIGIQCTKKRTFMKVKEESEYRINIKKTSINIFFIIEIIILIYLIIGIARYVNSNFERNIWFSLKYGRAQGTYYEGVLVERFRIIAISMTHILSIIYFKYSSIENKKYYYVQLIITLLLVFFGVGRSTLFILFIPIIFSYLYIKKTNNLKIFKILFFSSILLLAIFIIYAYMKFPYLVKESPIKFIIDQLQIYTVSPLIAFVEWCHSNTIYSYGAYTFRFFIAILSAIGVDIHIPELVNEYVYVGNDLTNVYTIFHYYAKDFGIMYSLIILLLIGALHGILYMKVKSKKDINIFSLALFTLSYYSLIMQFFLDQYISLLSLWIQYTIYYYIISNTKLFISSEKINKI